MFTYIINGISVVAKTLDEAYNYYRVISENNSICDTD